MILSVFLAIWACIISTGWIPTGQCDVHSPQCKHGWVFNLILGRTVKPLVNGKITALSSITPRLGIAPPNDTDTDSALYPPQKLITSIALV